MNRKLHFYVAGIVNIAAVVLLGCTEQGLVPDSGADDVDASQSVGTVCRSDRECSATGQICNLTTGYCVQCVADDDCEPEQACRRSRCEAVMPCTSSRVCPGLVCDRDRGYCVECVSEADCMEEHVCEEGFCVPPPRPCESDRECSDMALVCDPELRHCVECVADADCPSDRYCSDDRRCAPDVCEPGSTRCASGTTVATCTSNGSGYGPATECGGGASCSDGACQSPRDGGIHDGSADGGLPDSGLPDGGVGVDASVPREQSPVTSELGPIAASGRVCDEAGILTRGGTATGLGRVDNDSWMTIDEREIVACVTADFGSAEVFDEIVVVARAVSSVCGASCEGEFCGTGRTLWVFRSVDGETFTYAGAVYPTESFAERRIPLGDNALRYLLVCRNSNAYQRDQFLVDYVAGVHL